MRWNGIGMLQEKSLLFIYSKFARLGGLKHYVLCVFLREGGAHWLLFCKMVGRGISDAFMIYCR